METHVPSEEANTGHDVCVIGAGLVGLAVARALVEANPGLDVVIIDKESAVAGHQSSHNSGVAHSGLYYVPGSLKARLCVEGRRLLAEFCRDEGIGFAQTGKLVIATREEELPALDELERRGKGNGLSGLTRLGPDGIREIEPEAVGVAALHVPEAGVVDFPGVAARVAERLVAGGARVVLGGEVTGITVDDQEVRIRHGEAELRARIAVNCAGLQSDRVAALAGVHSEVRVVPFRGEYYTLTPEAANLVRGLIYPVPDPRFPFLGVHFTRRIDDSVEVGPNAVLALGREHYRGTRPDWAEVRATLRGAGFRRLARRHWRTGASEMIRSRSRSLYARSARALVPAIRPEHLVIGGAGVRAQAVGPDGRLVDDFVIEERGATIHVLNAPSPAATASLAIGRHIAGMITPRLGGVRRGTGV